MKRHHRMLLIGLVVLGAALLVALFFVTAPPAIAPSSTPSPSGNLDDETMRVAKNLYCPVCPGVPLDVCETQACQQWRALIREKIGKGETEEQIDQYFVEQYGERVLGAPRPQGFNLTIYILPVLAMVAGAGILYAAARHRTRARISPLSPTPKSEYLERIEQELKQTE